MHFCEELILTFSFLNILLVIEMDRVRIESTIVSGFFGEVTITINGAHAIGIAHQGIYNLVCSH